MDRRISLETSASGGYACPASMPVTHPLKMVNVGKFATVPEAFSLDGRLWSVLYNGVRTVYLVDPDNFEILDERQVRTTWYDTVPEDARDYVFWARGENWLMFSNEVIYHDTTSIKSTRLMYEFPLTDYRFRFIESDPVAGRITIFNQYVLKWDWLNTHTNPFPHKADSFIPPGYIRFQRAEGDYLLTGSLLVRLGEHEEPLPSYIGENAYQLMVTMNLKRNPDDVTKNLVGRPSCQIDEMQLQVLDGKLYGSAYRWCGRAYLFPMDFTPDGECAGLMCLYISNSFGINNGAFTSTVEPPNGRCAICDGPFGMKIALGEATTDGPWRKSEGGSLLQLIEDGGVEKNYEDSVIMSARFGGGIVLSNDEISKISVVQEDYIPDGEEDVVKRGNASLSNTARAAGAMGKWIAPNDGAGGIYEDEVASDTGDCVVLSTLGGTLERRIAVIKRGGASLPRLVAGDEANWAVQEFYAFGEDGTVFRSRNVKEKPQTDILSVDYPVWSEIMKTPVKLKVARKEVSVRWDASSTAPLLYSHGSTGNLGYILWPQSVWGGYFSIPVIWLCADGETLIDDSIPVNLSSGQYARFPVTDEAAHTVYLEILDSDYNVISRDLVDMPEDCIGMWKRNEVDWRGVASDTVGVHCNFKYTVDDTPLTAPLAILSKDSEGNIIVPPGVGRVGYCGFYHVSAASFFHLRDDMFIDMVYDLEVNHPTASNPDPPVWIPNGMSGAWLREWGADPYTDAFSKVRYRKCFSVITNWSGIRADPSGNKYWSRDRLMIVSAILDTEALDLAAEAFKCTVNT